MKVYLFSLVILGFSPDLVEARFWSSRRPAFVPCTNNLRGGTLVKTPHPPQPLPLGISIGNFPSPTVKKPIVNEDKLSNVRENQDPWGWDHLQVCASLWDLTPEETISLQHLGENLADVPAIINTPMQVVRFLKEFKSPQVAENKFRAMAEWRRDHQIDQLLEEYRPPSLYRYFPAGVLKGVDKDGDAIHLERTGAADSSGLLNRYGREEMIHQAIWLREIQCQGKWHEAYEKEQGHPVRQFTIVIDMKGLSLKNIAPSLLSVGQEVSRIIQDYYPGYTKRIIVIRAPTVFQLAYNALKPFIDSSMKEKMTIASERDYCKVLEQCMDLKVLPAEVYPEGQGEAVDEFDTVWKGGRIPDHEEAPIRVAATQNEIENQAPLDKIENQEAPQAPQSVNIPGMITKLNVPNTERGTKKPATKSRARKLGNWVIHQPEHLKDVVLSLVGNNYNNHPYAI